MAVRENLSNAPPAPPAPSAPVPMLPPAPPRPNEVVSRPVAQDKVGNHTASQNRKAPNMENIPLGHTAFSWPAVSTAVPLGHTAFSWESKLENNNLTAPASAQSGNGTGKSYSVVRLSVELWRSRQSRGGHRVG